MPAAAASAAITAGSDIAGGIMGSNAAAGASKAAQQAAQATNAYVNKVYSDTQTNVNPTIGYGNAAGGELAGLLGIGGNPIASQNAFKNYLGSTNYQFQLGQGENAIEYANAPSFNSSATAKALNNYAQGQAGSALQGYENLLTGQQTLGTQAALGLGGIGASMAPTVGSVNLAAAGLTGQGGILGAGAGANAISGLAGLGNKLISQSSFGGGGPASGGIGGSFGGLDTPSAISGLNIGGYNPATYYAGGG